MNFAFVTYYGYLCSMWCLDIFMIIVVGIPLHVPVPSKYTSAWPPQSLYDPINSSVSTHEHHPYPLQSSMCPTSIPPLCPIGFVPHIILPVSLCTSLYVPAHLYVPILTFPLCPLYPLCNCIYPNGLMRLV